MTSVQSSHASTSTAHLETSPASPHEATEHAPTGTAKRSSDDALTGNLAKRAKGGSSDAASTLQAHTRFFEDGSTTTTGSRVPSRVPIAERAGHIAAALRGRQIDAVTHASSKEALAHASKTTLGGWTSDSHFHPTQYTQQGILPEEMLAMMDKVGVYRSVIMPIPTDVIPCGHPDNNHIPAEDYYVPKEDMSMARHELTAERENKIAKSAHLVVNQQVDADTAQFMDMSGLTDAQRDRLDPMVTGLHLGSPLSSEALLKKLHKDPGTFTGVGEVTIHKELVERQFDGARQANLTDNVKPFKDMVATAGVIGMPVVMHCDVDSTENQRKNGLGSPQHLDGVKKLLASPEVKNTTMIWAHFGGIGRFVAKPDNHMENLREILKDPEMRHVHVDISWSRVARQIVMKPNAQGVEEPDPASIEAAAKLITEFPDRFLMGSDALDPKKEETWAETGNMYKPLLDKLAPEVRQKVTIGNYERVIVGARAKVRAFEKHVLTNEFMKKNVRPSGPTPLRDGPHIEPEKLRAARDAAFAAAGVDERGEPVSNAAH
ncbi:MAG TPA: hypothetical protein VHC91_00520 [Trinickia sp.]|uniref:hypothetical protein n=1 Tax=Trinickia sp. TaxID=2571163 RepID=UPI002B933EFD|nr:hypothetical protein [Trinickia sp.]HVW48878.1 hypothetical protein [Trinickia sp.]